MARLHPSAQWPEPGPTASVSIVKGYLYEAATNDFRMTGDATLGTHGFNSAAGVLSVVARAALDGSATIYLRSDGTYFVRLG